MSKANQLVGQSAVSYTVRHETRSPRSLAVVRPDDFRADARRHSAHGLE